MAREEILKELEKVQNAMFMEQMADFMNWANYRQLQAKEKELKAMLSR